MTLKDLVNAASDGSVWDPKCNVRWIELGESIRLVRLAYEAGKHDGAQEVHTWFRERSE